MDRTIGWVDSWKGIAVFAVLLVHTGGGELPSVFGRMGAAGSRGVQLFFIISAFLTFRSLERLADKTSMGGRRWLLKKAVRIIPLYYLAIFVSLVVEGTGPRYWLGSLQSVSAANVISHLLFINGFFPYYINSIIGVEWYLADLVIFYVLSVALYRLITNLERAFLFMTISAPVCIVLNRILERVTAIPDENIRSAYFGTFGFISELPVWLTGILLYFIIKENCLEGIKGRKGIAYAVLLLSAFQTWNLIANHSQFTLLFWSLSFIGLLISQEICPCTAFVNRFWKAVGRESYGIYLIHFLLIHLYEHSRLVPEGGRVMKCAGEFVIIASVSYGMALLLNRYFEKPCIRFLEKVLTGKERISRR